MKVELERHLRQVKGNINPNFFPNERFEYYSLPDYDSLKKPSLVNGAVIESNKTHFTGASVLISKLNPRIKRVWLTEDDNDLRKICSTEFLCLKTSDDLSLEYTFYAIKQDQVFEYLDTCAIGSTNSHVRFKFSDLAKVKIELPPLPTQRKIARILSTIDGQIEKTEAILAKYQAVKQGMLQDLFTRGIDVRTGQLRPPYEDAPDLYQESALGMIPKEWAVIELDEGIKILDCKHITPTYISNGIPLLRPRNIKTEGLVLNDVVYVSEADYQFLMEKHKLKDEDILFTRNASFGVSCFLRNDARYAIGQDVVILTDKTDEVTKFYIFQLLNSQVILKQIQRESGGSTFGRINLNDFRRFIIPKPAVVEQNKIRQTIEATDNILSNNRTALSKLQLLKQGMMQDLLSGKVEVKA